jgi:hypothetical protein
MLHERVETNTLHKYLTLHDILNTKPLSLSLGFANEDFMKSVHVFGHMHADGWQGRFETGRYGHRCRGMTGLGLGVDCSFSPLSLSFFSASQGEQPRRRRQIWRQCVATLDGQLQGLSTVDSRQLPAKNLIACFVRFSISICVLISVSTHLMKCFIRCFISVHRWTSTDRHRVN